MLFQKDLQGEGLSALRWILHVLAYLKIYLLSFLFDFGKFLEEPEIFKNPRNITNPTII
jgi:hypothetical protein